MKTVKNKNHTVTSYEERCPEILHPDTRRIINNIGQYHRVLETEDFIFFVNAREGDDNANVIMYRKSDMSLASNNYFAANALFEEMLKGPENFTYMSRSGKENLKLFIEANKDI